MRVPRKLEPRKLILTTVSSISRKFPPTKITRYTVNGYALGQNSKYFCTPVADAYELATSFPDEHQLAKQDLRVVYHKGKDSREPVCKQAMLSANIDNRVLTATCIHKLLLQVGLELLIDLKVRTSVSYNPQNTIFSSLKTGMAIMAIPAVPVAS